MSYVKVTLLGHVGGDAKLAYTAQGKAVLNFSLATNREWKNEHGEKQQETTWFRVALWGASADSLYQYLTKGKQVLVEGNSIKARLYTGRDGNPAVSLEVTASDVRLLGGGERREQTQSEQLDDVPF